MSQYCLPDLAYDFSALEPVISAEVMQLHYDKHHRLYVTNLNVAMEKLQKAQAQGDLSELLVTQSTLRFNAGGHLNHSLFWQNLAPSNKGGGQSPRGELMRLIASQWGSLDRLIEQMSRLSLAIQGSGWSWLAWDPSSLRLVLTTTNNHDTLDLMGVKPLLILDVWEHAYYLQYKHQRSEYIKQIWKVVNWQCAEERLSKQLSISIYKKITL